MGVNGMGEVPTLRIDGHDLTQSCSIIQYLDESRPDTVQILPPISDPVKRHKVCAPQRLYLYPMKPVHSSLLSRKLGQPTLWWVVGPYGVVCVMDWEHPPPSPPLSSPPPSQALTPANPVHSSSSFPGA